MTKVDEHIKASQDMLNWIVERCYELEEENKNLNKQIEQFKKWVKDWTNIIERLEDENKKLKEENEWLKETMKELNNYNKFRIQENKGLKEKLEQIKETYIRFEDSEKEYNKWLWELDQLIMNR